MQSDAGLRIPHCATRRMSKSSRRPSAMSGAARAAAGATIAGQQPPGQGPGAQPPNPKDLLKCASMPARLASSSAASPDAAAHMQRTVSMPQTARQPVAEAAASGAALVEPLLGALMAPAQKQRPQKRPLHRLPSSVRTFPPALKQQLLTHRTVRRNTTGSPAPASAESILRLQKAGRARRRTKSAGKAGVAAVLAATPTSPAVTAAMGDAPPPLVQLPLLLPSSGTGSVAAASSDPAASTEADSAEQSADALRGMPAATVDGAPQPWKQRKRSNSTGEACCLFPVRYFTATRCVPTVVKHAAVG